MTKVLFLFLLTLLLYGLEYFSPLKKRNYNKEALVHGVTNFSLIILGFVSIKILTFSLAYVRIDYFIKDWGLFNYLSLNPIVETILAIIIFDFFIWLQHLLSHRISLLWRFHRVHHCDTFLDTSSALRFHPFEVILSMIYKIVIINFLGMKPLDFALFELILTSLALFNHSNIKLPRSLESVVSYFIVTPNIHQVHHSNKSIEANSNYGFNLVIWDKLFGSFTVYDQVCKELEIGLLEVPKDRANSFFFLLFLPLSRD